MNSFISKVRKLSVLVEQLLQSEALFFHSRAVPHRSLFTKSVLLSNSIHKKIYQEAPFVSNRVFPSNSEENLGRIVDLDVDFEDVKADDVKVSKRRRKGGKKPVKQMRVLDEEEIDEEIEEENDEGEKSGVTKTKKPKHEVMNSESIFNAEMSGLKSKKIRQKKGRVIVEGKRLIHDAISAGCTPEMIFYTRRSDIALLNIPKDIQLYRISYKAFKLWSDVVTPQGVLGVFKMPDLKKLEDKSASLPLTIICDNIREPGNLGTIFRVAAAVGCKKIILTEGCVDIWEPKVIRAGAGAHFHFAVHQAKTWSDIESEFSESSKVFLADLNLKSVNDETSTEKQDVSPFTVKCDDSKELPMHCYSEVEYTNEESVIVIGGETQGLCSQAYKFAGKRKGVRVFIPLENGIESLNNAVALGILAYEIRRQLSSVLPLNESSVPLNESSDPLNESSDPLNESSVTMNESCAPVKESSAPVKESSVSMNET